MEYYYVGQVFKGKYPPKAAMWCNVHGCHLEKDGTNYRIVENPPPPKTKTIRTFSKFNIWAVTQQMLVALEDGSQTTVWAEFEKFMAGTVLPSGITLLSGWLQLVDLVEDNPFFEEFYPLACEKLGKELVDKVLAVAVTSQREEEIK